MTRWPHYRDRFPALMQEAQRRHAASPACHDWSHTLRVLKNARHLAKVEGADMVVVEYAAVLHDIGRPSELADQGRTCHAALGADLVRKILPGLGADDPEFVRHVSECVGTHRYRRRDGGEPASLEARIIYDADKLDSIGAIGIGRAFHFAGRTGARIHNTAEAALASDSYSREDTAYREYLVKLRFIQDRMLTGEGRRLARQRHEVMVEFFHQLNREVDNEDF